MTDKRIYVHMLLHPDCILKRDYLVDVFTSTDRRTVRELDGRYWMSSSTEPYVGKLIDHNGEVHYITNYKRKAYQSYEVDIKSLGVPVPAKGETLGNVTDLITIPSKYVLNFTESDTLTTTVGTYLSNMIIFIKSFGTKIPYQNKMWQPGMLEGIISDAIIREVVTPQELERYARNLYFFGHMSHICVPSFSRKSLTTHPDIENIKKLLWAKYGERIKAGDAIAMTEYEKELIAIDKEWLKDDPSMGFFASEMGKSFDTQRKRMFLTQGMMENFGAKGTFSFVKGALNEGWDVEDFHTIANEIRKGSYERAMETANGGEISKFLTRAFQNVSITEEDCGSDRYLDVNNINELPDRYVYRYAYDVETKQVISLDEEALRKYNNGKKISLRTPITCKTLNGFCQVCMGGTFKTLNQKALVMRANELGAHFLKSSLKGFHGSSFKSTEITSMDQFVLGGDYL